MMTKRKTLFCYFNILGFVIKFLVPLTGDWLSNFDLASFEALLFSKLLGFHSILYIIMYVHNYSKPMGADQFMYMHL